MALTIGQLARATGVPAKTIRYYEEVGVLPAPGRSRAGYRLYDEPGVHRVRFIGRARALGLPLSELKAVSAALDGDPRGRVRSRLLALVRAQRAAVRRRAEELQGLQRELDGVLARLRSRSRRPTVGPCRCLERAAR